MLTGLILSQGSAEHRSHAATLSSAAKHSQSSQTRSDCSVATYVAVRLMHGNCTEGGLQHVDGLDPVAKISIYMLVWTCMSTPSPYGLAQSSLTAMSTCRVHDIVSYTLWRRVGREGVEEHAMRTAPCMLRAAKHGCPHSPYQALFKLPARAMVSRSRSLLYIDVCELLVFFFCVDGSSASIGSRTPMPALAQYRNGSESGAVAVLRRSVVQHSDTITRCCIHIFVCNAL